MVRWLPGRASNYAWIPGAKYISFTGMGLTVRRILVALSLLGPSMSAVALPNASAALIVDSESIAEILDASDYDEVAHGEILRLYRAIFNREADVEGAKYWIGYVNSELGVSVAEITRLIANDNQPEFETAYADVTSNRDFVNRLYLNMLGRTPDVAGAEYWVGLMDEGLSRPDTARWVAHSREFVKLYPYRKTGPTLQPGAVTFTAGGDHGAHADSQAVMSAIGALAPSFHIALGDLGYSELDTEAQWCELAKSQMGDIPIQLIVGNHEDDAMVDGHINNFAACLPDRMNSTGLYAAEYYFDVPVGESSEARFILIGADNKVDGEDYDYSTASKHYNWLETAIDDARARDIEWIVVGMHKVCVTAGAKSCEVGLDVIQLLIDKRVDLILHGHEHNYQRSKQLSCVSVQSYDQRCVVDDGSDDAYKKGAGPVWVVTGLMGAGDYYRISPDDSEFGYLAESMGEGHPQATRGFSKIAIGDDSMNVEFVGTSSYFSDSFVISR